MVKNKAIERIHRIEEIGFSYMEKKAREKFLDMLYKQIDEKYKKARMVNEDELKRILGNVGHKANINL